MPVQGHNLTQVEQLLKQFGVNQSQEITEALQLDQKIQNWKNFIADNITPRKIQEFENKLRIIFQGQVKIKQQLQIDKQLLEAHERINQAPLRIQCLKSMSLNEQKWSDELMTQIETKIKCQINETLKKTDSIESYIIQTKDNIYDILARRGDLNSYFTILQRQASNYDTSLSRLLTKMNFNDFVILFVKSVTNKQLVGKLLSQTRVGIPIFYTIGQQLIFMPELLKNILSVNEYHLILNIGTPKTNQCGKTKLLSSLLSLNKKKSHKSYFSKTLNFYTQFAFGMKQRAILADFNGYLNNSNNQQLNQLLISIGKKASIIILHAQENQILQDKILNQPLYQQLLNQTQKIILFIRDHQNAPKKKIIKKLPQNLQDKVCCFLLQNLSTKDQSLDQTSAKILQQLFKKEFNRFNNQNKFCFNSITPDYYIKKIQNYQQKVGQIMKQLNDKQYQKKKILPKIKHKEQIFEILKEKVQSFRKHNQDEQSYLLRRSKIQAKLKELTNKSNKLNTSSFCQKGKQILQQKQKDCNQILIQSITDWKNQRIGPLKKQYIQLIKKLNAKGKCNNNNTQIKIKEIINQMNQYEISIDSLLDQIICQYQNSKDQKLRQLILYYYQNSLKNMNPINIINGQVLSFGNEILKQLMQELSKQYQRQNKNVYVISVIGAQSSAKSTLLNLLFRCSFQTSAGRCTKGVYFTVCQFEDLVIFVLDTEGLLSVSARDNAFDNQIATFILKVSNLIIINNKGELTSTLKELLKVCMYVLQCLHKDQKTNQYSPQKIIFTLRDQNKPKGYFQEQIVAQIKKQLQSVKDEQSIDYNNFFSIEPEDVFCLPNVFEENKCVLAQCGSYSSYNTVFGNCMFALRNRIFNLLKSSDPVSNLEDFYSFANSCWKTIQQCGKDIINYKSINQIIVKQRLFGILQQNAQRFRDIIQKKYDAFLEKIRKLSSKDLENQTWRSNLKTIFENNKDELTRQYDILAIKVCTSKQWIKDIHHKIYDMCINCSICYNEEFTRKIKEKKNQEKTQHFKSILRTIAGDLLTSSSTNEQIEHKFQKLKQSLIQDFKVRQQESYKNQIQLQTQIKDTFHNLLSTQKQKLKMKITDQQKCIEQSKYLNQLIQNQQYEKYFDEYFKCGALKNTFSTNFLMYKQDYIKIFNYTKVYFINFKSYIQNELNKKKIIITSEIENNYKAWTEKLQQTLFLIKRQLEKIVKNWKISSANSKQNNIRKALLGFIIQTTIDQVCSNNLQILNNQKFKAFQLIKNKQKQIKNALINRGNASLTIKGWIEKLKRQISEKLDNQCYEQIREHLLQIKNSLSSENILQKAITRSINAEDGKSKWQQCFKLITNINQYLFEIMCQQKQIVFRKSIIQEKISKAKKKSSQIINEIIHQLQKVDTSKQNEVSKYLSENDLIYLQNESFKKQSVLKSYLNRIKQNQNLIQKEICDQLNVDQMNQQVEEYIQNQLRHKIIGCPFTCPFCGMKCRKESSHSDNNHQVMKNCHQMAAFGGVIIVDINTPCYRICYTKQFNQSRFLSQGQWFQNKKLCLQKNYPQWYNHFPQVGQNHLYQGDDQLLNFSKIWTNIENVIIKHVHAFTKKDNKYDCLKDDPLRQKDLDKPYKNYKGQKVTLRTEYLSK